MIDLGVFTRDAKDYYLRLRANMVPGNIMFNDAPGPANSMESSPPLSISMLEAAEREAVALWRILNFYDAHKPFNPYMRAAGRRVIGVQSGCDDVVELMADDARECVALDMGSAVDAPTVDFCHRTRMASVGLIGELDDTDWITHDEAIEAFGLNRKSLWWRRKNGLVKFKAAGDSFIYSRQSLEAFDTRRF